jgi:hypothetical protein
MGKNNRQRRAEKARKRQQSQRRARPDAGWSAGETRTGWRPLDVFVAAAHALNSMGDDAVLHSAVTALGGEPPGPFAAEIGDQMERLVADQWDRGWQPSDLDRVARRELGRPEVALVHRVMAAQSASYEQLGRRVAPGWMAQLEAIGAVRSWGSGGPYLVAPGSTWPEALGAAVRAMALLFRLPALERLADPPSEWRDGPRVEAVQLPDSILDKVRALLAKAESTSFEAEADAFTAKAQELMARHRIDRAVLDARGTARREAPAGRRIGIDDPYADAKATLLAEVADANGCHAVWSKGLGHATAFGFPDELLAVEELFTSLLVQASAALRREGSKVDRAGRSRTTRFRRSFLVAFAYRVGQRLRDAVEATVESASEETGTALVPLLADRDAAVQEAAASAFPDVGVFSASATDGEGWYAGTLAGDRADLARGPALTSQPA